jgi:PAS domain S-box-containing protein
MKKILSGETLIFEVEHLRKNGQVIPLEVSANLVTIGKEKYVLGFHRDITERKLAEKNFQKIFDESPVGIIITGANSQFLKVNKRFCELVGYTEEELLEMGFRDITHPDTVASDLGAVKRMINGEIKTYHTEKRYIKKTGEPTWVLVTASAVFEGKSFLYFITTVEDINSKKLAEEQLLNKTQEINSFFDVVPDLLCISDSSEKFIRINKSWEKVLGYPVKELLGKKVLDFVHPEDREKTQKLLNIATQEPVIDFTNRYLAKDGSYRILEWRSRPVGGTVYSAARDITDREKMQ